MLSTGKREDQILLRKSILASMWERQEHDWDIGGVIDRSGKIDTA